MTLQQQPNPFIQPPPQTGAAMVPNPVGGPVPPMAPQGPQPPGQGGQQMGGQDIMGNMQKLMGMLQNPQARMQAAQHMAMQMPPPPPNIMAQLPTGQLGNMMQAQQPPPAGGLPMGMPPPNPAAQQPPAGGTPFTGNPFVGLR